MPLDFIEMCRRLSIIISLENHKKLIWDFLDMVSDVSQGSMLGNILFNITLGGLFFSDYNSELTNLNLFLFHYHYLIILFIVIIIFYFSYTFKLVIISYFHDYQHCYFFHYELIQFLNSFLHF